MQDHRAIDTFINTAVKNSFDKIFQDIKDFIYFTELNYLNNNDVICTDNYEKANKILIKNTRKILTLYSSLLLASLKPEIRKILLVFVEDTCYQKSLQP